MAVLHSVDQEQLQKLLLGQLSTADVERLATEYADDSRLVELAESLTGKEDALLALLHNHVTAVVDPEGERLVERLLERLKPAIPVQPRDDTAAMNKADAVTEPSSPDLPAPPQRLPERLEYYRPIKVLGQGGMGTVYLAEDTRLGREVAIKTLRPELAINPQAKERFLREARTAAKLEHDHIIPIYSVGEADGTPFLAMPLLKGEPLDALIRRTGGPLPVATVIRIAREAASGLGAAHERGLIHRDIKPANIWLEAPTGRVKILDFGLAKAADAGGSGTDSETHLTASGAIVGTPAYMAPEQASGHAVDGRADLFSLGCVLYELLSGKRAFSGPNTMSILMSLANHTPTAPDKLSSQCPAALSRLVMQLLEKAPANRPVSAEAVIQALSELDIAPQVSGMALAAGSSPGKPTSPDATTPEAGAIPLTDSDSLLTMPATAILPVRKRVIPTQRAALALAGVLLMLLAGVVYRIQTDKGTLVVEINDDDVEAKLKKNGLEVHDTTSGRKFSIRAEGSLREASGDYKLVDGRGLKLAVLDDDGLVVATNEFKLVRNGKLRVSVRAETNGAASTTSPKALAADPDRRAAEYVLSIGGTIMIRESGRDQWPQIASELPPAPYELVVVRLAGNQKVSDAALACFKDCKNLTELVLNATPVSDAGLVYFKNCKNLAILELHGTRTSDAGLAYFQDCKKLTILGLADTQATDAGLRHFQDCEDLRVLHLRGPEVTDAGLAQFRKCKNLTTLTLTNPKMSDLGLADLANFPKLTSVTVKSTRVTEAGVKKLSTALPRCRIEWDGGVIEPTVSPDRHAAEYIFSIGGFVSVQGSDQELKAVAELPREPFKLSAIGLRGNRNVTETGLAACSGCQHLDWLDLRGSLVTDAGLAHFSASKNFVMIDLGDTKIGDAGLAAFQGITTLRHLWLVGTNVTDVGLANFVHCKNLLDLDLVNTKITDRGLAGFAGTRNIARLFLAQTSITDSGLAHFRENKDIRELWLGDTQLTDVGLSYFQGCKNLTELWLGGTRLTDAGLVHFKDCNELTSLSLGYTKVTDAGLAHFQNCQKLTHVWLGKTQVSETGLANFRDCKNLTELYLTGTQLSDAGLADLTRFSNLTYIDLTKTKVTEVGVKKLSTALPRCKIEWDGGVIEQRMQ